MSVLCFKESSGLLAHGLKKVSSFWVYLLVILKEFRKRIRLSLWCQLHWSLWEVINQHLRRMTSDEDGLTTDAFLPHVRCVIAVSSVICGRTCPVWSQYYCQSSEVCSCKFLYQKSYNVKHISAALWQSDTESPRFSDATTPCLIFLRAVPRS